MTTSMWTAIERDVAAASAGAFRIHQRTALAGGCINSAHVISGGGVGYFVKTNAPERVSMFEAEAAGLHALRETTTVRVPRPICQGSSAQASWIVLEHVELTRRSDSTDAVLGTQLAAMHRCVSSAFGWHRDNTIGSTPQVNAMSDDWLAFYGERRLRHQLKLAATNGYNSRLLDRGSRLLERLPQFFTSYVPVPSLLHGDLWSGNAAADKAGAPVIFDPAVYYGDREADIAMTELFGGYSRSFYAAYNEAWPLDAGYSVRKPLYNLYHVLNHLNLFGGGYLRQAEAMIDALLSHTAG